MKLNYKRSRIVYDVFNNYTTRDDNVGYLYLNLNKITTRNENRITIDNISKLFYVTVSINGFKLGNRDLLFDIP